MFSLYSCHVFGSRFTLGCIKLPSPPPPWGEWNQAVGEVNKVGKKGRGREKGRTEGERKREKGKRKREERERNERRRKKESMKPS